MNNKSYATEYIAWGSGIILLGLVLYIPAWIVVSVLGVFFVFLWAVHHTWG